MAPPPSVPLAEILRKYSKPLSPSHQVFLGRPGMEMEYVTPQGVQHYVDWTIRQLPRVAPSLEAVTWLPKSGLPGKAIAEYISKKCGLSLFPMAAVRSMPFNTLIIAPRLDAANAAAATDLEEFMTAKKIGLPPLEGYHSGDYIIWALVIDDDVRALANIWCRQQSRQRRVFTCIDHALLGM